MKDGTAARPVRVTTRNAAYQQWHSLLSNRTKRFRTREFLVQGVRPITTAVEQGWTIKALLQDGRPRQSSWAAEAWTSVEANHVVTTPELLGELAEKPDGTAELVAVVEMPPDDLSRITWGDSSLVTVFDRPSGPGNVGTLVRSVDAFGGAGLVVTGHAADPYDPKCVRASTGSFFSVPVVRTPSHRDVLEWVAATRAQGIPITVVGTDETGSSKLRDVDLTGPTLMVIGNETTGLTSAWREQCDLMLCIPMRGTASSLNAASAGTVVLYEAMRQR